MHNFIGDLSGVAFITGAASGMGRATAIAFAKAGSKLILVDINATELAVTEELVRKLGAKTLKTVVLDITKDEEVRKLLQSIPQMEEFGRLDYALNCAGVVSPIRGPPIELSMAKNDWIMSINFRAQGVLVIEQLKLMLSQKPLPAIDGEERPRPTGIIVNWTSWAAHHALPTDWAYASSKHALLGMTRSIASAYAGKGIRCNAIAPGVIKTPMIQDSKDLLDAHLVAVPAARHADASEVANTAIFLCSDMASYVNGVTLHVDGGWDCT